MQHMMKLKEKAATLFAAVFVTVCSFAGVKYWDNPEFKAFDVGDYVQDGLVVNYDGIRNAGPTADHDPDATTWVNCKTPGTYDLTKISLSDSTASWVEGKGFHFDGKAYFKYPNKATLPAEYEFETLLDAKTSDATAGIGQIYFSSYTDPRAQNDGAWGKASLAIRQKDNPFTVTGSSKCTLVFNTQTFTGNNNSRPGLVGDTSFKYLTALANSSYTCVFTGLEEPTSAPGRFDGTTKLFDAYFFLGGHGVENDNSKVAETMIGTMKNFRRYNKVLTPEQRAWNRFVDEARYFGHTGALPVTNVVVASNIPIVTGDEPIGCYAVDGSHTFSAPASKVVKGRTYTLDGFTIETWNGSAWSAAVEHAGETSYTASDSDLVRLTWRWTAGDGLVAYDADDYVQYGLVLNYDGIRNAGLGAAHDSSATTWKNLGNGGAAYDMTRYSLVDGAWVEGTVQGSWTDDGFTFSKNAVFHESAEITIPTKRTMQVLVDAKASAQGGIGDVVGCYNGNNWAYYTLCMRSSGGIPNSFYLNAFNGGATARPAIYNDNYEYHYGTAIVDENDSVFFSGTTAPWSEASSGGKTGHYKNTGYTPVEYKDAGLSIGGRYPSQEERFTGTVKSFRFYNRCLTDAEVAWNRVIDDWRYVARSTNVLVQSTYSYLDGNEKAGSYEVVGAYTFTAPETVTAPNGITYAPDGYTVETWSGTDWVDATTHSGNAYAYTTTAGKVRLTWHWKATYGCRSAADYTIDDLASGAVMHFDGIDNAGIGTHSDSATKWVNLGTAGSNLDASLAGSADDSAWTEYGYNFKGKRKFMTPNDASKYIHIASTYTLQSLVDAPYADNIHKDGNYILATGWNQGSIQIRGNQKTTWFLTQQADYDNRPRYTEAGDAYSFATAILDDAAKTAVVFPGTKAPKSGTVTTGYKQFSSMQNSFDWYVHIGGANLGDGQFLRGTLKSIRYYDRVLTEEELVRNRNVDSARYFGKLAVTNVVVSISGEETAYKVEGAYTFNAPATVEEKGETKNVAGCFVEQLVDGEWIDKKWHEGAKSFAYDEATEQGKIYRITWGGPRPGMMIIVK